MRKTTHVVPAPNGGWNVKQGGGQRASGHHPTQKEAIEQARELSLKQHSELVIHGRDGRIRECDSHGKDPYPPKG
ncbi:MAG: DUF2188 domain-containing protein [Candidatus Cloacimonetes bacterium]|nr:DUF2188 domain-containing protein [Candidatus Cloacimonadota bacterium]